MQILCATDFSGLAVRAADVAASLAKALGLPLRLVHSMWEWTNATDPTVPPYPVDLWKGKLDAEAERLRSMGVEVTAEIRFGAADRDLVAVAAERPTKVIVMGSTGQGLAERWLLGSVAERVAESAPVPTLVVREAEPLLAWLKNGQPLRALCAVDFNLSSDAALAALKGFAKIGRLEVEAVHVRQEKHSQFTTLLAGPGQEAGDPSTEAGLGRDVLDRVTHIMGEAPVRVHVPQGGHHADHELARLAEGRGAGLIVLGTHQRHGWQRLAAPSFSRGVLAHASTNVMCVPVASYVPPFEIPGIRRVLVATEFSSAGHDEIRHAFGLPAGGGEVHLLHVVKAAEPGVNPLMRSVSYLAEGMEAEKEKTEAQTKFDDLLLTLRPPEGVLVTAEVMLHTSPATAICEAAERFGADVICLGSGHRTFTEAVALGSVSHSVIGLSKCPVFVVPPVPV